MLSACAPHGVARVKYSFAVAVGAGIARAQSIRESSNVRMHARTCRCMRLLAPLCHVLRDMDRDRDRDRGWEGVCVHVRMDVIGLRACRSAVFVEYA